MWAERTRHATPDDSVEIFGPWRVCSRRDATPQGELGPAHKRHPPSEGASVSPLPLRPHPKSHRVRAL